MSDKALTVSPRQIMEVFAAPDTAASKIRETKQLKRDMERDPIGTAQRIKEEKLKACFLIAYARSGTIGGAIKKLKIPRSLVVLWREEDLTFAEVMDEYDDNLTDSLEEVAIKRAKKKSDALLIKLLEVRRPDKFKKDGNVTNNFVSNKWIVGENVIEF